ncbi:MAG: hypothetical protein ACRDH9_07400 [Actinomycetota bacterium]
MKKILAPLAAFCLVLMLAPPAGANHFANHTCGIFPRDARAGTAGYGFSTPETAASPATDNILVEGDCLSLWTHEPFTAILEVTFQWLDGGLWRDSATLRCEAVSHGSFEIEAATAQAPGNCPATHVFGSGESRGTQHRALMVLTTNVKNGPYQVGQTAPWSTGLRAKAL